MSEHFSEESLRKIAEQKVEARRTVKIHIAIFLLVNAMLFIINFITLPDFFWFLFPLFAWFIGLSIHIIGYILYIKGVYPIAKRTVIIVLTSYFTVMLLLITINYITLNTINWALYPGLFIGSAVLILIIIYAIFFRSELTKEGEIITKKEKAIQREMDKLAKRANKSS
jgi:hypothetical protein